MHDPVDIADLPPEVVFAALYDVAWSPGLGSIAAGHSSEHLALSEARRYLESCGETSMPTTTAVG
jgi:hypothetical protein